MTRTPRHSTSKSTAQHTRHRETRIASLSTARYQGKGEKGGGIRRAEVRLGHLTRSGTHLHLHPRSRLRAARVPMRQEPGARSQ